MAPPALRTLIQELAQAFQARFPRERVSPLRTVGREAEHPLVREDGTAGDLRALWPLLAAEDPALAPRYETGRGRLQVALEGYDYAYQMEVGLATVEIAVRPCTRLQDLCSLYTRARDRLCRAAQAQGWAILGYGIQPVTPPAPGLMAPKARYQALYRAMGDDWLWYTVTASDQIQVAISRDEMIGLLNALLLLSPAMVALCGHSPVYGGRLSPYCSAREGRALEMVRHGTRHGMPPRPYTDVEDLVARLVDYPCLVRRVGGQWVAERRPFREILVEEGPELDAFLLHEHYIWHAVRLRAAYGTVEIRPACQQPPADAMAATALALGLVEAAPRLVDYVEAALGAQAWTVLRQYYIRAARDGLAAPEPCPGFLENVLGLVEKGLERRGQDEQVYLGPLWERLERRRNPAQRMRRVYRLEGMEGLLVYTRVL